MDTKILELFPDLPYMVTALNAKQRPVISFQQFSQFLTGHGLYMAISRILAVLLEGKDSISIAKQSLIASCRLSTHPKCLLQSHSIE
jgi:hypothetical protein